MLRLFLLFTFLVVGVLSVSAIRITGSIYNEAGESIPYCFIQVVGTKKGTTADEFGKFKIDLSAGSYTFKFIAIGYEPLEQPIDVSSSLASLSITLKESAALLETFEVLADGKDLAKEVMSKARDMRGTYVDRRSSLQYLMYQKTSLVFDLPDTASAPYDSLKEKIKPKDRPRIQVVETLQESFSTINIDDPQFKEIVTGYHDYKNYPDYSFNGNVNISVEVGEPEIIPQQHTYANPYIIQSATAFTEYDLYQSLLDLPALTQKPITSPLASSSALNYNFKVLNIFVENGRKHYTLSVEPRFKGEALFEGTITIEDESWALKEAKLNVNPASLFFFDSFHIHQVWEKVSTGVYYLTFQQLTYEISEDQANIHGSVQSLNQKIQVNPIRSEDVFTGETKRYEDTAYDRDSTFWASHRAFPFSELEQEYAELCDSLQEYYTSEAYYDKEDSTFNDVRFMDFILYGVGFRQRAKGNSYFFFPLIMQVNPVGIGGYRHRLGGTFVKEFDNAYTLETEVTADYGFRNKDVRGKGGIGLTYIPLKFVRTFIRFGDYYDMINNYASIGSIFSRSNYVRSQTFSISQRMEIVNGLFAELTLDYSDQKPITDLSLEAWSSQIFGDINTPIAFDRYIKAELRLDMKYRIQQKYIIKKGKKILLGSVYPELSLVYRKGLPEVFKSEVDFDYIEIGAKHSLELGRFGQSDWSFNAGTFFNKGNLRVLEHRYFRGSDALFFSDPVRSMQLLGPTLSTANTYIRGNYFHHLDGFFLNKIPLIRRLKITEAFGGGFLSIPEQKFVHTELYVGLERIVRIKRDLFRFGIYACTAASSNPVNPATQAEFNFAKMRFEFKLGVNFYNTFTKRWSY